MKYKQLLYNLIIIVYILLFVVIEVMHYYDFEWISIPLKVTSYALYLMIACAAIYCLYKTETKIIIYASAPILGALFFLSIGSPILQLPIILVLITIAARKLDLFFKGISLLFYICIILISIFAAMLGDFGSETTLGNLPSPNGQYQLLVIDSDQGALGGNTFIELKQIYSGVIKRQCRTLYIGPWGDRPTVKWLDNETALVNNQPINITK